MTKILAPIPPYTFNQKNGEVESNTCVLLSLLNTCNFSVSCDPVSDKNYYIDVNELILNWKSYNPDKSLKRKLIIKGMKTSNSLSNRDSIAIYEYLSGAFYATSPKTDDTTNITFKLPLTTSSSQTVLNKNSYEPNTTECIVEVSATWTTFEQYGEITLNNAMTLLGDGPIRFGYDNPAISLASRTATGPYDSDGFLIINLPLNEPLFFQTPAYNQYRHAIALVGIEIVSSTIIKFYCVDTYGSTNKKFVVQYTSSVDIDLNSDISNFWPVVRGASRVQFTVVESGQLPQSCCETTPTPTTTPTPSPVTTPVVTPYP
jgi:hypothetical protein